MSWRTSGDAATPGRSGRAPSAKTKAPHDLTYGAESEMLDEPGTIVEPEVREKVSDYLKTMGLRECIRFILKNV